MENSRIIGICNLHNLNVSEPVNINLDNIIFSQDGNFFLSQFNATAFSSMWGKIALNTFIPCKLPFFYINWIVSSGVDPLTNENCLNDINAFLMSLWFVKDCSVNTDAFYTYLPDTNGYFKRFKNIDYSDCHGLYQPTLFNQEEINKAFWTYEKILSLTGLLNDKNAAVSNKQGYTVNHSNFVLYDKRNRISRAFGFLQLARINSFLPTKIAFYICIYECLFTNDINEVTHKVAERVSLFMGNSYEEKKLFYKIIKDGYNIRSKYFHGQLLKKDSIDNLKNISKNLDDLTRITFNKIIGFNDNLFLDATKHEELLNNIIFK